MIPPYVVIQPRKLPEFEIPSLTVAQVDGENFSRIASVGFTTDLKLLKWVQKEINSINKTFYKFRLTPLSMVQYSEYPAEDGGIYNPHMDMQWGQAATVRKLSMSYLLNDDFEGGQFGLHDGSRWFLFSLKAGQAIFFPSFLSHKVEKVTKGVRKSLVVWAEGPNFR